MNSAPHPLTLRQLQYAVAVADESSFGRAAARCRVAQPSLSAQIAQLEEALGVRLFERDRRSAVRTTAAGAELVERARRVLVEADELVDGARRHADPLAGGRLRLGVIPTVAPYLLPELAPALRRAFPRLAIAWTEERTAGLVQAVERGELDAALVALEADLGGLAHEPIAADPFVLATQRGHPLARRHGPVRPAELDGARVLLLDEGHCLRGQALAICQRARADELAFRATSLATLAQMVAAGEGVTFLPASAVAIEARRARLAVRPFAEPAPARTLALAFRRGAGLERPLRAVAGAMRDAWRERHTA
jgi:LysR family hydrogen peroxide-inducible transcriptional activator